MAYIALCGNTHFLFSTIQTPDHFKDGRRIALLRNSEARPDGVDLRGCDRHGYPRKQTHDAAVPRPDHFKDGRRIALLRGLAGRVLSFPLTLSIFFFQTKDYRTRLAFCSPLRRLVTRLALSSAMVDYRVHVSCVHREEDDDENISADRRRWGRRSRRR